MMNIKGFEKIVNDRTDKFNDSAFNKNVARVIKNKRVQSQKTQSEIAEGICSISYISKIESGKCPPDNFYVREIMSKMGITLEEVMISEFTTELYDIIECIYHDDEHKVTVLVELTEGSEILSAKLVQLAGRLYLNDDVSSLIQFINAYKADLNDYELMVFMYLIARYEANFLRYKKASKYLMILKELDSTDRFLEFLVDYLIAECNLYIGTYVQSYYYLNKLEKMLQNAYEITNLYKVKLLQVELLIYTNKIKTAKLEIDRFTRMTNPKIQSRVDLLNGLIEHHSGKTNNAVNLFLKSQKHFFEISLLFIIMTYSSTGNMTKVKEYLTILEENTSENFYIKLGQYYAVKLDGNMYELREYINKNLLHTMKKMEYDYFYDQVMNDLINFHRHNSRYKAIDELRFKMSDKR